MREQRQQWMGQGRNPNPTASSAAELAEAVGKLTRVMQSAFSKVHEHNFEQEKQVFGVK